MIENKVAKATVFDKIYFCFFLFLPFVYIRKVVDPVLIPRQLLLTLFLAAICFVIQHKVREKKLPVNFSFLRLPVFIAMGLFLVTVLLSFFQSVAFTESIYVFSKVTIEVLFCIVTTYLLIQRELHFSYLVKAVTLFSLISLGNALYQAGDLFRSSHDFFDNMLNVNSTFGHKNLFASILFLTFPFLLNAFGFSKIWKRLAVVAILLSVVLVWLIQTKAVVIAILLFFFILILLVVRQRKREADKKNIKKIVVSAVVLIVVASIVTIANRQKFPRLFDKNSSFERLGLWENSIGMIKEHPVLGVGAGNWQIYFPKYGLDKFATPEVKNGITTFQRPHNDFLWVWCELGIMGMILYLSIFAIILYYLVKLLRENKDPELNWKYATFFAALIGYILIAFVDFPLERIEHQLLLNLFFAIVSAHFYSSIKKNDAKEKDGRKLPVLAVLLFFSVLLSGIVGYKRYLGECHTQRMYAFERTSNWTQMNREAEKAVNPFYSMDPMSAPIQWYKGVALFSAGNMEAAKNSFETAYALHPYNIHVINNLASCYENLAEHQEAEKMYLKALAISSDFEEARLNLSAVYYNGKEYDKAFETIDKCDVKSKDEKYQLFLPAILNAWLDEYILREKNPECIKKLKAIKGTKNEIVPLYVESKKKGINFKEYIFKLTN